MDISTIQGSDTVSSAVFFENGKSKKKFYRHFIIRSIESQNDYAAMQETMARFLAETEKEPQMKPDLIVIDGGKGQLSASEQILRASGKENINIIALAKRAEEVFVPENRALLLECLKGSRLKYHQYYPSRLVGSGLLIMSAYPIREVFFHQYKASNPWYRVWEGDWWAGKGVALARIELPDGSGFLDFYDTHAQAGYGIPDYREVRKFQMGELARFVNASHLPTAAGLLVGDMNCGAGSDDFEIAVTGAKLVRQMAVPSAIDHIFEVATPPATIEVSESLEIRERNGLRLSDHNGYVSTIVIRPS